MIFQGFGGQITHHFLMFFRSRFHDHFLTVLGSILSFILGPKCAPKGTQNESRNQYENQVEKESQKVAKRTPNINLSRIEREARFKIAKANTPYAQRKQVNLTSQEIVETIPETKKGRTPYPQGEHAH